MNIRLFDEKFKSNKEKYIIQSLLCGIAVGMALVFFDVVRQPMIIASFGASGFIAFTMPHRPIASARHLIGGYVIAIIVGCLMHALTVLPIEHDLTQIALHIIASIVVVTLAMFIMSVTNTEHAPATSIALGLVINDWTYVTVARIMVGILIIVLVQRLTRNWMMDLLG